MNAPTGRWKDGLCDFCSAGIFHPSFWCALCCTQIGVGQVMSRMELTWLGEVGPRVATEKTFQVVLLLVACYYVFSTSLSIAAGPYDRAEEMPQIIPVLKILGSLLYSVWAVYSLCKTRENVRARYQIPERHCQGCEDVCLAAWCGCCVTAQLLRHTGEYENYPGTCCTETGLPPGTPSVV